MKTRFCRFLLMLFVLPLFASAFCIAQDQSGQVPNQELRRARFVGRGFDTNVPRFDVEIADGQLSLAPLKGRVDPNEFNLGEGAQPAPIESVPATIANLAKYIRAADTNANITVAPSATEIQIKDLKLHGADVPELMNVIYTATDGIVNGVPGLNRGEGHFDYAFQANPQQNSTRTVEVMNISGYIHSFGNSDETTVQRKIDEIQDLIRDTLKDLHKDDPAHSPTPVFHFHRGTGLLIVIGSPEAIEITRKFVEALPGQQAAQFEQAHQLEKLLDDLDKPAAEKQK